MQIFHRPVLLNECLDLLAPEAEHQLMVDGTLGEGGHSEAFLRRFKTLSIIGVDADSKIQSVAKERLKPFGERIHFITNWSDVFFSTYVFEQKPSIILLDLGISIFHYEAAERGFSFLADEPLDMRLSNGLKTSASDIVNKLAEKDLADVIFKYGEEHFSRRIAHSIVEQRKVTPITSSKQLADIIFSAVPSKYRYGRLHPATRTFQAIRIAVNGELDRLPALLELAFATLEDGGKLGVISFHSLEDRIVKHYFRELSKKPIENNDGKSFAQKTNVPIVEKETRFLGTLVTKKGVKPSETEVAENSPSRSAKLRVIRKNG